MRARHVSCVSMMLMAACAPAPAPQKTFDAAAESTKLLARDAEWAEVATAGKDVDKVVSYWTDDAVLMESGQPTVEGKDALRKFVAASFAAPGFKIHWVSQKPTFSPDGQMAYMRSTNEVTAPGADGRPMQLHMQGYTIWRVDADGQWRCVVDFAGDMPPQKAASKA